MLLWNLESTLVTKQLHQAHKTILEDYKTKVSI